MNFPSTKMLRNPNLSFVTLSPNIYWGPSKDVIVRYLGAKIVVMAVVWGTKLKVHIL